MRRAASLALGLCLALGLAQLFAVASGCGGDDSTASTGDDGGLDASQGDGGSPDGASVDGALGDGGLGDASTSPTPDAAPFTIDPSYGTNGVLTANFGTPGLYEVWTGVGQADGKVILAGGAGDALLLIRYTTGGVLDPTFGTGGVALFPVGEFAGARNVMVQADQKIVVVGEFAPLQGGASTVVARFDSTGAIDTSFGDGGRTVSDGYAWSGALQADGKILAATNTYAPGSTKGLTVYRYTTSGALDTTFGNGGAAATGLAGTALDPFAILELADGKILVGGNTDGFTSFFVRFTSTGVLDTTFNGNGVLLEFQSMSQISEVAALAQEPDGGRVYAGGLAQGDLGVGRYFLDGGRDPAFGPGSIPGWVTKGTGYVNAMALQPDGQIVIGGGNGTNAGAVRFTNDGGVDTTFGNSGFANAPINDNGAHGLVLGAGGDIVLGGQTSGKSAQITRLTSTGAVDTSFGTNGLTTTSGISGTVDEGLHLALQPDGKPLLFGAPNVNVLRATTTGTADTSLGPNGAKGFGHFTAPGGVVMQSTNKSVVCSANETGLNLVRFDANGTLDATFGASGKVTVSTIASKTVTSRSVALGASDTLVAVGNLAGGAQLAVLELTADGQPVTTFAGGTGAVVSASDFGAFGAAFADVAAVQPDGKVVVAVRLGTSVGIARLTTAGVLDPTFGTGGAAHLQLGVPMEMDGLAILPDGSIVAAGQRFNADSTTDAFLLHFTAGGQLDPAFGSAGGIGGYPLGKVQRPTSTPSPIGFARAADGRLLVTAAASTDGVAEHLLLLRFTTSGVLDAKSVVPLSAWADFGHAVAVQSDGKILVGGATWTFAGGKDFFLARFSAPP